MGPPSRPASSLDRKGRYRRWRPFFLISRAIVDRSQLLALTPEDAEDAAALRLCHADEKLRLIRTIIINNAETAAKKPPTFLYGLTGFLFRDQSRPGVD